MLKRTRVNSGIHAAISPARLPRGGLGEPLGERRCRSACHHEAAHAIIGQLQGLEVIEVRIEPIARTYFRLGQVYEFASGEVAYAACLLAGGLAGRRASPFDRIGDELDQRFLAAALTSMNPRERARIRRLAGMRARGMLAKHWPAIVKMAARLRRYGAIEGKQAARSR